MTPEQFSYLDYVKSYPGMHSLCLAMRFRKISLAGCVRAWHFKMTEIFGKSTSPRDFVVLGGPAGGSALERASPPMAGEK